MNPIIDAQRFSVIHAALEDCRKIIATAKLQRWETVKWAITLNVGLAALTNWPALHGKPFLAWVAWGVAIAGIVLILVHNNRAKEARRDAAHLESLLCPVIQPKELLRTDRPDATKWWYDWKELSCFVVVLLLSAACIHWLTG